MKKYFLNPAMILTLSLVLIQQMIVASSNYWLVWTTQALEKNEPFKLLLLSYVLSLLLPYIPGALALIGLQKWISRTQKNITDWAFNQLAGKINIWGSESHRSRKLPVIVRESPAIVSDTCNWSYSVIDAFLNFSLNIITLSMLIHIELLYTFLIGMTISFGIIWLQRNHMSHIATEVEGSRTLVTDHLQGFWDNVVIGNLSNKEPWKKDFNSKFLNFDKKILKFEGLNQFVSVSLAFFSNAPIFIYLFYVIYQPETTQAQALALIVLLPRVYQIVNSSHFFLWQIAQANSIKARMKYIQDEIANSQTDHIEARIKFEQIMVNNKKGLAQDLITEPPQFGRRTLTGQNGPGKSSLLLCLKNKIGDDAFYLPAKSDLSFEGPLMIGSTGEKMNLSLRKIFSLKEKPKVLLLDEWDGNLDQGNKNQLDELIEKIAQEILVVEVRHGAI